MPGLIEDYALLGDLQTAALVGRDGSIDWLCLPRFDSSACFAALLGDESHGRWLLAPAADGSVSRRRYRPDTLVLETQWTTPDGTVRVVDCMPPRGEAADVVRLVEGISGTVPMRMELTLRFDYGRVVPWVRRQGRDLAAIAGPDAVWLRTEAPVYGRGRATVGEFAVQAGQRVPFVLTYERSYRPRPRPVEAEQAVAGTMQFWREWIGRCGYEGGWAGAVRRALLTLKALTYAPTGAILAAATTSLPEQFGGTRNWDYRYCWLRDATFTLQALLGTGYVAEAKAWREWLLRAVAGDPADLQIMYALDGTRRIPESTLDWLTGYQGLARSGSATPPPANCSLMCGVRFSTGCTCPGKAGSPRPSRRWDLQHALLDYLEGNWRQPDNSLWEVRGRPPPVRPLQSHGVGQPSTGPWQPSNVMA